MRQHNLNVPTYDHLLIPSLKALIELGGSATVDEIDEKVIELQQFSDDVLKVQHKETGQTEITYRLGWSRTYLKKFGLIDNSSRGIWTLIRPINPDTIDPHVIVKHVQEQQRKSTQLKKAESDTNIMADDEVDDDWQTQIHKALLALSPDAFERLVQRLLRESGFIHVEVTGRSGDSGIDGIGIARISGFLRFHVLFQCKRYQGSVTPNQIRDFRGAMQGRTDKGLFLTTGTFTREAVREATRDGAPPIDLVDGQQLIQRLKELKLGVIVKMVERVEIDENWFTYL